MEFVAVVAEEAVPLKIAVMVPAEKFPEASRATIVFDTLFPVAFEVTVKVPAPD